MRMGPRGSLVFFLALSVGFFAGAWHEHGVACHNPPGTHCGTHSSSLVFFALGLFFLPCALVYGGFLGPLRTGRRLARTGKRATAVVEEASDTGITLNLSRLVKYVLRVQPLDGPPFEVRGRKLVSRISTPRRGETVTIRYDPEKPHRFIFDDSAPF